MMKWNRKMLFAMLCMFSLQATGCGSQTNGITESAQEEVKKDVIEVMAEEYNLLPAADCFAGGDGSEENPYQIANAEQLAYMSEMVNGEASDAYKFREGYYVLTADVELNNLSNFDNWKAQAPEYEWKPIGSSAANTFRGHFNGNGYVIKGMYIENDYTFSNENISGDGSSIGLFGYLSKATVENVVIEDSLIVANRDVIYAGSIAGSAMASEIVNCRSSAKMNINMAEKCGGIIGHAANSDDFEGNIGVHSIKSCVFDGHLSFLNPAEKRSFDIGGIAGYAAGVLEDCSNKGTMQLEGEYTAVLHEIGGVVGNYCSGNHSMSGCVNEADIVVKGSPYLGGICGNFGGMSSFSDESETVNTSLLNCTNAGNISASGEESCVGGILGGIGLLGGDSFLVKDCANSGNVSGGLHVGGICGESISNSMQWELVNCTNAGGVDSGLWSGGIIGYIGSVQIESAIKNSINEGSVSGKQYVGGIVGGYFAYNVADAEKRAPFTIESCENKGAVSQSESGILGVGGIIGYLQLDTVMDKIYVDSCKNSGVISGKEALRAGGILGGLSVVSAGPGGFCSVTNCENTGDIMQEGGTVRVTAALAKEGELSYGNTEDKVWSVLGGSSIGGIAGYFKQGIIENCTSTGSFYIQDGVIPMFSYFDLSRNLADDETEPQVFVGGICGLYYYEDGGEGYSPETCYVRNCWYDDSIPEGVVFALPDEATLATVSDIKGIKGN